jgi:hypothetical protein
MVDYNPILAWVILAFICGVLVRNAEIRRVRLGLGLTLLGLVIGIGVTSVNSLPPKITFPASVVAFGFTLAGFLLVIVTKIRRYPNHPT